MKNLPSVIVLEYLWKQCLAGVLENFQIRKIKCYSMNKNYKNELLYRTVSVDYKKKILKNSLLFFEKQT